MSLIIERRVESAKLHVTLLRVVQTLDDVEHDGSSIHHRTASAVIDEGAIATRVAVHSSMAPSAWAQG